MIPRHEDATVPLLYRTVRVYRNLRTGSWSVQAKVDGAWRVVSHAERIELTRARFVVSEAGRRRVCGQKRKNVHAWVEGQVEVFPAVDDMAVGVRYNPYTHDHFFTDDNKGYPVRTAQWVRMTKAGVRAVGVNR